MFNAIAKPFGVLLMLLYDFCSNYGIAVLLFAIIVKLIMLPFQMKSKRGMMQQQRLIPRQKELEKKHGANKVKYQQELTAMYKEEGVNPASGCLWGFLPLPIVIALYQAVRNPLTIMMGVGAELLAEGGAILTKLTELGFVPAAKATYDQIAQTQFISRPENIGIFQQISSNIRQIDYSFLGMDLGATPQWKVWNFTGLTDWMLFVIPVIAAILSFSQMMISQKMNPQVADPNNPAASTSKMMMFVGPLMSLYIGFIMPAALGLYWGIGALLDLLREVWLTKHYTKIIDAEDKVRNEARRIKEAELERKRAETERLKSENRTTVNPNTSKEKQKLAEKIEREARAAEYEKAHSDQKDAPEDPAREGNRRYARGRAYNPERFGEDGEEITDEQDADSGETDE
ncbi:MAG: YidC/Oxa1 family membrane protein insertase [Oscillospiraceae bacterium]|jgi:YidC/Oxa1 family membrane protein insertase|nr:YidC/Oxa1 family membrane protein insertase [Oscillospiraceae bacterium]